VTSRDRRANGTPEDRPTRRGVAAGMAPKGFPPLRLGGQRAAQVQQEAERIDEDMVLAPGDLLARQPA